MDDLHCGPHTVKFESGTVHASVSIPLVNDDVQECDETFIAHILRGDEGSLTSEGFRIGKQSSTSITIVDEGKDGVPRTQVPAGVCICHFYPRNWHYYKGSL